MKKQAIQRWKAKVGEKEAEVVKNTAATRGTAMHSYLEYHIAGQGLLDLTESGVEAKRMAEVVVEKGLGDLDEIWGSECVLYYPELYAGQTDLCGVYQGRESIVDFKQSNKPKREEYIGDYYLQLVAYAMAHDAIYKTNIEQGVILMCTPDLYFQKFVLNGARFRQVKWAMVKVKELMITIKIKKLMSELTHSATSSLIATIIRTLGTRNEWRGAGN
jgi:hypothetical protein